MIETVGISVWLTARGFPEMAATISPPAGYVRHQRSTFALVEDTLFRREVRPGDDGKQYTVNC